MLLRVDKQLLRMIVVMTVWDPTVFLGSEEEDALSLALFSSTCPLLKSSLLLVSCLFFSLRIFLLCLPNLSLSLLGGTFVARPQSS